MQSDKRELIGELKEKRVTTTIDAITPTGIKFHSNFQGQFTGKYNASHTETVEVDQRMDGTLEWKNKSMEFTTEGDVVVLTGEGKGKRTGPNTITYEGTSTMMTQSKRLASFNNTKVSVEGTLDNVTGENALKAYSK